MTLYIIANNNKKFRLENVQNNKLSIIEQRIKWLFGTETKIIVKEE